MGIRYIGSKSRVADSIVDLATVGPDGRFVDAFSGTGAVAAAAVERGWRVTLNDSLPSAVAMSVGSVVRRGNVPFVALGGYQNAIRVLNDVSGRPGFIHAQYSPASLATGEVERRYFTESNAARIDAMRSQIALWSDAGHLAWAEEQLLLADLMQAANRVANISGTYGCFLRQWSSTALRDIKIHARLLAEGVTDVDATIGDVFELATSSADTVYFDPPYTKRQYSAYYHVLETICAGDAPEVGGITGLRPWRDKASDFCYKTRALDALTRLVLGTSAKTILLSYSNEGHVQRDHLVNALSEAGAVQVHELRSIGRYRPNAQASSAGETVNEFVIQVTPIGVSHRSESAAMFV